MREVSEKKPTGPADWELAILTCNFCGKMWKFDTYEESKEAVTMMGMGSFYYKVKCPCCTTFVALACHPFYPGDENLFRYIYELEQKGSE